MNVTANVNVTENVTSISHATVKVFKVASNCFLKLEKIEISTSISTMNISEKNETKAMHRVTFGASNSVNDKVFHLLL